MGGAVDLILLSIILTSVVVTKDNPLIAKVFCSNQYSHFKQTGDVIHTDILQ